MKGKEDMNNSDISLIVIIVICIIMSAYFSATETAFSSLNKIKLKNAASKGKKKAIVALELSENYDQILSTILIGNNIVNIASASLATVVFTRIFDDAGITLSTVVMTVIVLIFGEISPKSIAKDMPESWAMMSAPILKVLCFVLSPINSLFTLWKKFLNKVFKSKDDRSITEEEILTMVEEAQQDGGINEQEGELIRSAVEFNDLDVVDVLTPRIDVVAIEDISEIEDVAAVFLESGYSRIPVYHHEIDHIIGIIHQKDFYNRVINLGEPLEQIIAPVLFVTPTMKISKLMKKIQQEQTHMAVIVDEYGGTKGIVTLEDILEELVGEIWDEHDEVVNEIEQISDCEYKVLGSTNIDKMFEALHMEGKFEIASVNGWVSHEIGKIPCEGEQFEYEHLSIQILKADERRVLEIKVTVNM